MTIGKLKDGGFLISGSKKELKHLRKGIKVAMTEGVAHGVILTEESVVGVFVSREQS